jgi:hypothetical protein
MGAVAMIAAATANTIARLRLWFTAHPLLL